MPSLLFSRTDPFEVAFFRISKWILGFLGLWPLDPFNRRTMIRVFINLSILLLAIIGEIRFTWFVRKEPIEALAAICPCLTKVVTWMKMVGFVIYRKEFANVLNTLYDHLVEDTTDRRKNALIGSVSHFTIVRCLVVYFFASLTGHGYTLKPLIVWAFWQSKGKNDSWVGLPFPAALPYKDMTQLQNKTLYSFMYCLLAYSGTVTTFGFPGVDGAFMCFCMYISVSYQCLQDDIRGVFKGTTKNDLIYEELSVLVKRQQNIILVFNRFNRVYRFMIFGHFLFASIALGIILINLVFTSGALKIIYLTYSMGACSQLYIYCYGAENLNESCLKLSETLYFCDWYKCDKKVQKLVLFIIVKTQKGSRLSAPFFSPSIPLFATIIRTSVSYITILRTLL